jgi:DNA-binding response OmpR family regulator
MRILVVEDQPDLRDLLKSGLEAECFAVDTTEDGERGVYLARTNEYDMIIMDYIMPKLNGIHACEQLRRSNICTPVLMLSVRSEPLTKAEALNGGADDFLTKPFSFEELKARVRALMRRPRNIEEDTLRLGDLVMNIREHRVEREGKNIYLTRKEFMLLEYLLRNKGTVMSRAKIMEHVWDMNLDPFSNTIESHILSIRKKIDREYPQKYIHTMPGFGYKADVKK